MSDEKKPQCPECGSTEVDCADGMKDGSGRRVFPKKCRKCGFGWSDNVRPEAAAEAPAEEPVDAPATPEEKPAEATPFDVDALAPGQVIRFLMGEDTFEGPVVKVTDKTVVVDVDGEADTRVHKDRILGLAG